MKISRPKNFQRSCCAEFDGQVEHLAVYDLPFESFVKLTF